MRFDQKMLDFTGQPLTRQVLLTALRSYQRPYDKISELVRQKALIPVKRGVFVAGPALAIAQPEPFLLANHLLGPSYVSAETALSHWQLIPERVYETSSATTARSKIFDTALGRFSYIHLPLPYYSFGQQQLELAEKQTALIAIPEKALCDKIVMTAGLSFRSTLQMRSWLTEDMRMDRDVLRTLDSNRITEWLGEAPKRTSLALLVKTLETL